MMAGQTEFCAQRQDSNSKHQHPSPKMTKRGKKYQPDERKEYKEKNRGYQVHRTETEVRERPVHADDAATMSTTADGVGHLGDIEPGRRFCAVLKTPGKIQGLSRLSGKKDCGSSLRPH